MASVSFPVSPTFAQQDRRTLLRRAAGLGAALPIAGALTSISASADDGHSATPEGYASEVTAAAPEKGGEATPFTLFDPVLPVVTAGPKTISVDCRDASLYVAKDVAYLAWTFDGTVPGTIFRVVEGDQIDFTLTNSGTISHSLDFHSAKTPPNVNYKNINPGESFSFSWQAKVPGAYMYHCGTPPVMMHIGAGMYGAMIVDPVDGWSPAQELVFVQSEFHMVPGENKVNIPDYAKMASFSPDYITFNGYANQYVENPIPIKVGEPVRIFVVNAGPNVWSSFHVVGAIFDKAYINANPNNLLQGLQSISIGPGDGACVEFTVEEPGEYVAVNHSFGHASKGAVAILSAS